MNFVLSSSDLTAFKFCFCIDQRNPQGALYLAISGNLSPRLATRKRDSCKPFPSAIQDPGHHINEHGQRSSKGSVSHSKSSAKKTRAESLSQQHRTRGISAMKNLMGQPVQGVREVRKSIFVTEADRSITNAFLEGESTLHHPPSHTAFFCGANQ